MSAWKLYWMLCITSPWLPSSENKFPKSFPPMLDSGTAFFSTSLRSYSHKAFFSSNQSEVSSSEEDFVTIYDTLFLVFRVHILLFLLLSYIVYFLALLFTFKLALNFGIFLNIIIFFKHHKVLGLFVWVLWCVQNICQTQIYYELSFVLGDLVLLTDVLFHSGHVEDSVMPLVETGFNMRNSMRRRVISVRVSFRYPWICLASGCTSPSCRTQVEGTDEIVNVQNLLRY